MLKRSPFLFVFSMLFALSGFAGLIYESIWSHYLKLFLGHASYAQVLVLVIFMGGMAIGSAIASRVGGRVGNLLLWYGIVELVIGLFGVGFHHLFTTVHHMVFAHIFPHQSAPLLVNLTKWTFGALLILPQSILLGATFPLFTAGVTRHFPEKSGQIVATLYFVNSFGAALGILVNSFILIPRLGLPGSVLTAGLTNIILGIVVYVVVKRQSYSVNQRGSVATSVENRGFEYGLLAVAALTGMASFLYEVGWIRMLSMVLGGSTHSFEIMLSAFIFGLALGGLWIRGRIDRLKNPVFTLGIIQLVMASLAILTIPLYNQSYELFGNIYDFLKSTERGYFFYVFFSYCIALLIMLPATICAGATLPLITSILLNRKHSDSVIGKIYALNTVGAIVGVVLAVHFLMPVLGLKWVVVVGALIDVCLGVVVILWARRMANRHYSGQVVLIGLLLLVFLSFPLVNLDKEKMASGVFRDGGSSAGASKVIFHRDGKTSTVAVTERRNIRSLLNNGKVDGQINMAYGDVNYHGIQEDAGDEPMEVLLGALGYVYRPDARLVANIGLGTGLTADTLLLQPSLDRLDIIEIEQAVVEAAPLFLPSVKNVFERPRSRVIIEDARTFLSTSGVNYDLIVSEPSDPWVSGIANLFTTEFYRQANARLADDGIFVQWVQGYEISPDLVANIYNALAGTFAYIHLYATNETDMIFIGSQSPLIPNYEALFKTQGLRDRLRRVDITVPQDIEFRQIANKTILGRVFASLDRRKNSDYFPILEYGAPKARFLGNVATPLLQIHHAHILRALHDNHFPKHGTLTPTEDLSWVQKTNQAVLFIDLFADHLAGGVTQQYSVQPAAQQARALAQLLGTCPYAVNEEEKEDASDKLVRAVGWALPYLDAGSQRMIFKHARSCEMLFTPLIRAWIGAHLAWLDRDFPAVMRITAEQLNTLDAIDNIQGRQLLALALGSHIALNKKVDDLAYLKKLVATHWLHSEFELLALLHWAESNVVRQVGEGGSVQ